MSLYIKIKMSLFATLAWGYKTLPGDTRVITGAGNARFSYKTTLPGNYTVNLPFCLSEYLKEKMFIS